jgi:hypothetical protein
MTALSVPPRRPKPSTNGRSAAVRLATIGVAGGALAGFAASGPGAAVFGGVYRFLAFYAGVFSLVALSLTVMCGLAATDRLVLMVRHRVVMQAIHRSMATAAMVFLAIHILIKVGQRHASLLDVFVPFLSHHRPVYVGLGTIASYLMAVATGTGVARARFAGISHPWIWRALHASAYACWPIALLHGLNAGRSAKGWVSLSYALCLIIVGLALIARLWVTWGRHLRTPRTRTTAILRPVASHPVSKPVGRWINTNTDTVTDEEFWAYLRNELLR